MPLLRSFVPISMLTLWMATMASAPLMPRGARADQRQTSPALKVESRIVLVDVVITDGKGQFVGGLQHKDFQISEDGKPQTITSFEEHVASNAAPVKLPPMPANVFTNFPTTKMSDSANVVLFDTLNTQYRDQSFVRDQLIHYLKTVPQGTQVAIFVLGSRLRMVRGFTTDFSGLSVALDDKKDGANPQVSRYLPTPSQTASELTVLDAMMRSRAAPEAIEAFKQFMADEKAGTNADRTDVTLRAFQQLARYLSSIPVRKNVIWFAGEFPISFVPDNKFQPNNHAERVRQTSNMLTAGQIAVYPISAEGIVGDPMFDVSNIEGSSKDALDRKSANIIAMETLAQETGGRAFYNTNRLDAAVNEAIRTGSRYYTLAYTPSDTKMDGRFRRIHVSAREGDGFKLAYRRGYFADKPFSEQAMARAAADDDPLIPLIGFGMPNFDQILYKIAVQPSNPQPAAGQARAGLNTGLPGPLMRYTVDFAISPPDLRLAEGPDKKRHGQIEIMLIAYDHDGNILNILKRRSRVLMEEQAYEAMKASGFQIHEEIDVPGGEVYLRTGIFDLESGNCGTLGIPLRTQAPAYSSAH
jgi:VWFA-related protein